MYGFQMPSMEERAVREAHVMAVEEKSIVTERQLAFAFDVRSVKNTDLDISRKVELNCEPVNMLHGLALSFDCCFTDNVIEPYPRESVTDRDTLKSIQELLSYSDKEIVPSDETAVHQDKPNVLSTSCQTPTTHWKQTALFFPEPVDTSTLSTLSGTLMMHRSPANHRSYYIRLFLVGADDSSHRFFSWVLE